MSERILAWYGDDFTGAAAVMRLRAASIALSSVSQNLLRSPLTCRWSAPARRQNFDQAT